MNFHSIFQLLSGFLTKGMFVSILLVAGTKWFIKGQGVNTHIAQNILKWIILSFTIIGLSVTLFLLLTDNSEYKAFTDRATGPYALAFWLMLFFSSVFPLLLFHKKLGQNIYFLLIVSVLMNFGWLIESFIIHISSMHRDYADTDFNPYLPSTNEIAIVLHGFIVGAAALIAGNIFKPASNP